MNFHKTEWRVVHPDPAAIVLTVKGTDHVLTVEEARELRDMLESALPTAVSLNETHRLPQNRSKHWWWRR